MQATVVGAGIGGLAAALRLRLAGYDVAVLEKNDGPGGRLDRLQRDGYTFDTGPSLLLMLDPLRKLFSDAGERLEDHLDLRLATPTYRVTYADDSTFTPSTLLPELIEEVRRLSPADVPRVLEFYGRLTAMYREAMPLFVRRNYDSLADFIGPRQVAVLLRHRLLSSLWRTVGRSFADPRLRMAYSFQTMYLGLSPLAASQGSGLSPRARRPRATR